MKRNLIRPAEIAIPILLATLALPAALSGADWPQWRGPNRDGAADKSPALMDALPAAGPALLWEYALPPTTPKKPYYGSPAVAAGRVYLRLSSPTAADPKTMTDLLVCVNLADGKEVWKLETPGGGAQYGAPNTPCIADGKVYCVGSQGAVLCLDAATGKEVWKVPFEGKGGAFSSSILVADGKVFVADTALTALDAATGAKAWVNPEIKALHNSPAIWRHEGKTYLLAGQGDMKKKEMWKTFCVDATSGKTLWNVAGGVNASPVVSGDTLVVLYWETGLKVYRMTPAAATEIGAAPLDTDDNLSCTPAVQNGKVYGFASKEGFCYDIEKKDFLWRIPTKDGKACSPILADGKLIQLTGGKTLRLYDPATGKDLGPAKGASVTIVGHSSPALADGRLVVNAGTHLRCYDLAKH